MTTIISHSWTDPGNEASAWPRTVAATAIARPVLDLLSGPRCPARVHSAFFQAANLEVGEQFVALTAPAAPWVPNGLALASAHGQRTLLELRPGQHAWIGGGKIIFPDAGPRITGDTAERWDPALARNLDAVAPAVLAEGFQYLAALCRPELESGDAFGQSGSLAWHDLMAPFAPRIAGALDVLVDGLARADRAAVVAGACRLAGLGPGLTPAGDDILVGACAALTLLACTGEPRLRRDAGALLELRRLIAETAAAQTSALSAAWLRHAGRGEFSLPLLRLGQALASGRAPAIAVAAAELVRLGASSGRCTLTGLLAAGQALVRRYTAGA
ncbi:hypothetical protein HRbin26_01483 [bacterium HR26]|nr:hypothetical protein HRbin26_01483 [bacterium HR26]